MWFSRVSFLQGWIYKNSECLSVLVETNTSTVILKGIENNHRLYRGGKRVDQQRKLSKMEAHDTQEDPLPLHAYCKMWQEAVMVCLSSPDQRNCVIYFLKWAACRRLGRHSCQNCVAKEAVNPVVPFSLMSLYFGTQSVHLSILAASSSLWTSHSTNTANS